jgi:sec-independent protein translocase protein TatA
MGPLGMQELVIIFVVALVIFGPRKLPELGRSLGKSLSEFKRASNELRSTLDEEIRIEDRKEKAPAKPASAASTPPSAADAPPAETHSIAAPVEPETVARGEQGA